ncbi:MAG: response regulator transcription factor [Prevotella sp.]|nr:response regulator transcription factor [Prevotella sp.]
MKVLIIEDEFRNANRLKKMLIEYDEGMQIEGPLESVVATRQWLASHPAPDIIFSDIRLSDGLSFDALDQVDSRTALVFTTAYDEYALQAFRYNGLAYLMKPVEEQELFETINRIRATLKTASNDPMASIGQLLQQLKQNDFKYRERFLIPYKDGYEIVNVSAVSHVCTEFKDTRIYLKDGHFYSISMSLDEVEHQLDPNRFFRVNRQFIVQVDSVEALKTYFGGKIRVKIRNYDEEEIMCSRDRAPLLKTWLNR